MKDLRHNAYILTRNYCVSGGIKRETSPFFRNDYPFRFIFPEHYNELLVERGFVITYLETISRTYRKMQEKFEFVTIVGEKPA